MRKSSALVMALVVSIVALYGCDLSNLAFACAGVGYDAVRVSIRDLQGNPQALNAVVTLTDGSYREQDSSVYDPLNVNGAQERGGRTYDVLVSKPHYRDVLVRKVKAPGGGCVTGHEKDPVTITVPVVLSLLDGAPAVRSVRLLPPHILIDRLRPDAVSFTPYVDVNVGLSRAVLWRIEGDTASVSFDASAGTFRYRCLPKSGYITVTALSVADSTVVGRANLAVQGHPPAVSDPPCS
ncbi:MAG: hypothetical protein ABJB74_09870 [Gemmatimonas sp.]